MKTQDPMMTPDAALIYTRVSDPKQETDGSGHDSQEHRCRQKAHQLNCPVEAVFYDTMTGGGDFMKRAGMVDLLAHLDANPHKRYLVVFDDLKRYARDTEFHLNLRREMMKRKAIRICLNFKFEDTPEGKFLETILAATGTLEREQNARQTKQKMIARMEQGWWVFHAPKGYKYVKGDCSGKYMVPDEPLASVIREAMEGYACGRLESLAEVRRFLQNEPLFPKGKNGYVPQQRVSELLRNPLYAGYICHEGYGIKWLKARHEPLISLAAFEKIQERRSGKAKVPERKNLNPDFPLRGFVLCHACEKPLTANWSKGERKKYPYYICDTRGCSRYRKSIRREKIEGAFEPLVQSLQPTPELFGMARTMFLQAWEQRAEQAKARITALQNQALVKEKEIGVLVERIVSVSSATVISAFESRIEKLERERRLIEEKLAQGSDSTATRDAFIERGLSFLASPWNIWKTGRYEMKRLVLRLAFLDRIIYCPENGYRTPKTTLPFKVLQDIAIGKSDLVRAAGLEPARPKSRDFKSLASTNFAMPANMVLPNVTGKKPQAPITSFYTPFKKNRTKNENI